MAATESGSDDDSELDETGSLSSSDHDTRPIRYVDMVPHEVNSYSSTDETDDIDKASIGTPPSTPRPLTWNPQEEPRRKQKERTLPPKRPTGPEPPWFGPRPDSAWFGPSKRKLEAPAVGGPAPKKAASEATVEEALLKSKGNVDEAVASLYSRGFRM
jgi:hypothetical protein